MTKCKVYVHIKVINQTTYQNYSLNARDLFSCWEGERNSSRRQY